MRTWTALLVLGLLAAGSAQARDKTSRTAKTPVDKAFAKTKKEFQQRIRNKNASDRAGALKLLEDYPTPDAADLVYVTLLDDRDAQVRQAAVEFLAGLRDKPEVVEKLFRRLTATTQKEGMGVQALELLRALAGTEDDLLQNRIVGYLNEFLGTPQCDQYLLHAMIDEQAAKNGEAEVLRMLMLFSHTHLFEKQFGFRRCVVQG